MKAQFIHLFFLLFICLILSPHANCQPGKIEDNTQKSLIAEKKLEDKIQDKEQSNPRGSFETSDKEQEGSTQQIENVGEQPVELDSSHNLEEQFKDQSDLNLKQLPKGKVSRGSTPGTSTNRKTDSETIAEDNSASQTSQSAQYRKRPKTFDDFIAEAEDWLLTSGIQAAIIFVLTIVAMIFSNVISKRLFEFVVKDRVGTELKKRATTLSTISRYLMAIGILAVGGMMILKKLGVDIAPLLAGAGVLGIALGFGAQNLVKDLISGAFILLEDQIRVGDVIQIADKRGIVEKVTLRMVVLRDVSGNVHFIPSGDIQVVTNMTKSFSRYLFDIGVAYKENTDEVIKLMKAVDEEMREDEVYKDFILAPLEVMGVQRFESSSVIIRARTKTHPGKQWRVGREFNRRFKLSFDKNGIEIPFPHMTVYQGIQKDGGGSPLNIHLQDQPSNLMDLTENTRSE